jgi:serine/threonine protein kinase
MAFSPGSRLGPYEILAPIGAGGMGEVHRARDTRLGREVAIKVSAERFSDRFEREARAIASLNHPNICTLYDVGPDYLVMELVNGPTLADRIGQGKIQLDEALDIARQIGEALQAAHNTGIVHRDLKPANIKLKPDGAVKVLDFGLAKIVQTDAATAGSEHSATLTMEQATRAGTLLGTTAYMAPEQAVGKEVDKRADIWAFGVVLYEMLTGQQLFGRETISDTLTAVITEKPDWERVPAKVRLLLRCCLQKDPQRRLHDIADAQFLLEDASGAVTPPRAVWPAWSTAALLLLVTLLTVPAALVHLREKPGTGSPLLFQLPPPDETRVTSPALSPDGRMLAFIGTTRDGSDRLWVRSMNSLEPKALIGTEGVRGVPFWSWDSHFLLFTSAGKLKKFEISAGATQTICDMPDALAGGFWDPDNRIVFGTFQAGLSQVDVSGRICQALTTLDLSRQERSHGFPILLQDRKHFLYTVAAATIENSGIYVGSLDSKPSDRTDKKLLPYSSWLSYIPSQDPTTGHLLSIRASALVAQQFSVKHLELTGDVEPIATGLTDAFTGVSASENGTLIYQTVGVQVRQLTWLDRQGKVLGTAGSSGLYNRLALSPDGRQVAVQVGNENQPSNLWLMEFQRGTTTRFTFGPNTDVDPLWFSDGSRIVFSSNHDGHFNVYEKAAGGGGSEEAILRSSDNKFITDISRDGRWLLYTQNGRTTGNDLWSFPLRGDRKPLPYVNTEFAERLGQFSPDGHWVAYISNESGRFEVYVRPFPIIAGGGKWMISSGGGTQPRWRRDGKELFFISPDGKLVAVEVRQIPEFQVGSPKPLFQTQIWGAGGVTNGHRWDAVPDGQRFLINSATATAPSSITVVLNWQAGLKK